MSKTLPAIMTIMWLFLSSNSEADTRGASSEGKSNIHVGIPIAFTFKAGLQGAPNSTWSEPSPEKPPAQSTSFAFSIEVHRLANFVVGTGLDLAMQDWAKVTPLREFGPTWRRLSFAMLYGSFGRYIWTNNTGRSASWISADYGRIWAGEEFGGNDASGGTNSFAGQMFRLRASWFTHLFETVAVGIDAGWQWAQPSMHYTFHSPRRPDQPEAPPHLNLSGPMISARVSLISPLGRGR